MTHECRGQWGKLSAGVVASLEWQIRAADVSKKTPIVFLLASRNYEMGSCFCSRPLFLLKASRGKHTRAKRRRKIRKAAAIHHIAVVWSVTKLQVVGVGRRVVRLSLVRARHTVGP